MGWTCKGIKGVLERLREGYLKNKVVVDEIEACKNDELDEIDKKYFRKDGENMALDLLMKTKRRYR